MCEPDLFGLLNHRGFMSAADAVPMPQAKPRAVREHLVVPSICSGDVACAEWSGVGNSEDALQPLDFGDGLFGVHLVTNI